MIEVLNRSAKFNGVVSTVSRESSGCGVGDTPLYALGNPFPVKKGATAGEVGSREDVIENYEAWLRRKIEEKDPAVCKALNTIYLAAKEGNLGLRCWYAPLPCHADVIVKVIREKLPAEAWALEVS